MVGTRCRLALVLALAGAAGAPTIAHGQDAPGSREQRLAARRNSRLNEEVEAAFRSADTTYLVGDIGRAAEMFARVLAMSPASNFAVRAQARLGDCAYEQKNYEQAAALYRRAAAMDQSADEAEAAAAVRAEYMVGQSFLAAHNYTSCFGVFRRFIDRHPNHALVNVAYQSIGDAHMALEEYQQALAAYRMVGTVAQKTIHRIVPGSRLYVRVTDADVNVGPAPRSVTAVIRTVSGDEERLILEPMGHKSAVFLGTIPTALATPRRSGELEKAFAEQASQEIRDLLAEAQKMRDLARMRRQDAVEIENSAEKRSNPAGAEQKRVAFEAEAKQLEEKAKANEAQACRRVDLGFASLEKMVADWAPEQAVAKLAGRATTSPTTEPGPPNATDLQAAMATIVSTPDENGLQNEAAAGREPSENQIDAVRLSAASSATTLENLDARLTAISVWARLLKRQFQRLEVVGGDRIEIEYLDEIGPRGRQNVIRKDSVEVASDAAIGFRTRDGNERITQVVLGSEVMIRAEDLDRDLSDRPDQVSVMLAASARPGQEGKTIENPARAPTTRRATPGELQTPGAMDGGARLALVPAGAASVRVMLTETGPHTGVFQALVKTGAGGVALPLTPGTELRAAYEDERGMMHPDGWVVADTIECIADSGGEAIAVRFGQTYLDQEAKLKRAVAAGEIGKIYLDLGLFKRGKAYLSSAQADCEAVAREQSKTPLGEEALYHSWRIYFYAGLLDESVSAARKLMAAYPTSDYVPEAMFAIGQASLEAGKKDVDEQLAQGRKASMNRDLSRAASQLEEMARRYPKTPRAAEALFLVGQAKVVGGQTGIDIFERLAREHPDSAFAARGLKTAAEYYQSIGDLRRAQEYYGRIVIDYPDSPDLPDVMVKRGMCQFKLGQTREALASFYKVAEEHPGTAMAREAQKQINFINQKRGDHE